MRALTYLHRLTTLHPRVVVVAWLAILALAVPLASRQSTRLIAGGYAASGSQSAKAEAILRRDFPRLNRPNLAVLLWPRGQVSQATFAAAITRVERGVRTVRGVGLPTASRELASFASGLSEPAVMELRVDAKEDRTQEIAEELQQRLNLAAPTPRGGVEIHLLGEGALRAGLALTSKQQLADAERVGFPVVLLVLFLVFGSVSAAALPIVLGVVSVISTGAVIYAISSMLPLSIFITNTASLLGIGVAVDYSLIIVARVRQELRAGHEISTAQRTALHTSGATVVFSGITVVASLAGLSVIPSLTLRSMALGAILAVAVSVVASVTLLPALITLLGPQRLSINRLARTRAKHRSRRRGVWTAWTHTVMRHPIGAIIVVGSALLALCVPALEMRTSTGALQQLSRGNATRVGFAEAASLVGSGTLGPAYVTVRLPSDGFGSKRAALLDQLRLRAKALAHVRQVGSAQESKNRDFAAFTVTPQVDPESAAATRLIRELRRALGAEVANTGAKVAVGGTSAIQLDEERSIAKGTAGSLAIVLILAFVLLAVVLRSIVLPFKAIVMNLLSVGAAYGVLVIVFQWGWLSSLTGFRSLGHLNTLTPPLILAIVFGLSMDYEVFLLSRIKEQWLNSGNAREAVERGLAASAQTISSAALILVCVFAVFIGTGMPTIKELGLGAAVAVAIDATLVRLVLVPATMQLLGRWSWWLPHSFARWRTAPSTSERAVLDTAQTEPA